MIAELVKNPPAMQETRVQFLRLEDPLEKGYATHTRILGLPLWLSWQIIHLQCGKTRFSPWVGKIPWRRERLYPLQYSGEFHRRQCMGSQRVGQDCVTFPFTFPLSVSANSQVVVTENVHRAAALHARLWCELQSEP